MDLSVVFLGTGGAVPSARRSTASVLVSRGGERLLFDCGEGTQRQMQRSLGLVQVDEIYLTHFHADHFLGLPGLLKTYDLTDREAPLTVYGPRGLVDLFKTLAAHRRAASASSSNLVELEPATGSRSKAPRSAPSRSSTAFARCGYALVEDERPGRFDPEAAKRLGVGEGPDFAALQRGEQVVGVGGTGQAGGRDGGVPAWPAGRDHRRHSSLPGDRRGGSGCRAPRPRRELLRGGGPARRRHRPLNGRPGGRGSARGRGQDARPGPHLLPLPRRQGARGGPTRSTSRRSLHATSTSSRSRSQSEASRHSSRTGPGSAREPEPLDDSGG